MKPYIFADWEMDMPEFDDYVFIAIDKVDINKPEFRKSKYKVFVQAEPFEVVNPERFYEIADQFDLILAWHEDILNKYKNAVFFPFGTCWIPRDEQKIHPKTKKLSLIASTKVTLEGHKLRHEVVEKYKDRLDAFGKAYKYVEYKTEALNDYMFSVIIENVKINNYFSEKLIDSIRTGTVPIHWGTKNIADFFDTRGFIFFEKAEDIGAMMDSLTKEKYESMLPYIQKNFDLSTQYAQDYQLRIHEKVVEYIKNNPKENKSFIQKLTDIFKK